MRKSAWCTLFVLCCWGCESEKKQPPKVDAPPAATAPKPAAAPAAEAPEAWTSSLGPTAVWSERLPQNAAGFERKSSKEKTKSDTWIEHSATYVRGDEEVKVVINENKGGIHPDWETLLATLEKTEVDGRSFAFHEKGDKRTFMTIVPPRFRVDVKSRLVGRETLLSIAKSIPHPTQDWWAKR